MRLCCPALPDDDFFFFSKFSGGLLLQAAFFMRSGISAARFYAAAGSYAKKPGADSLRENMPAQEGDSVFAAAYMLRISGILMVS
jgi:hypothetical protein